MQNELIIRIRKNPTEEENSNTFHCLIFDPNQEPQKSNLPEVRDIMELFTTPSKSTNEITRIFAGAGLLSNTPFVEELIETQLTSEELANAINERVVMKDITFEIGKSAGKPNIIADFYAKTTNKDFTATDVTNFIISHEQLLQTPIEKVSKKTEKLEFKRF